jgi:ATP-dependent helicase/nuclease subunit A
MSTAAAPKYTPEQQRALGTRTASVALDAGAGCGKTFVLTERYLSHLDPKWCASLGDTPAALGEVVAMTFTDAAAREMRARIRLKCRERLATAPEEDREFWRGLVRSLDGARVSTIHGFCGDLARRYAVELGLDPGFRVLAPSQAGVLQGVAVDRAIRRALADEDDTRREGVVRAVATIGFGRLRQAVRLFASHPRREELARWRRRTPHECVERWIEHYRGVIAPAVATRLLAEPAMQALIAMLPLATPVKPGFAARIEELRSAIAALSGAEPHEALLRLAPLLTSQYLDRKQVYGNDDWPDADTKKRFTEVLKNVREPLQKQRQPGYADRSLRAAELGLTALELAEGAHDEHRSAKRDASAVNTDDLLTLAHRLLKRNEFAEVRERARAGIRVLLVDEFQDTDSMQVEIVRALVGDDAKPAKGSPAVPPLGGGKLFFVGDEKQSIYRFRNAEPEVFRALRDAALPEGRLPLSQNFRSQPAVLEFVNALFAPEFGAGYQALRPSRPQGTPRPAVDFLWTAAPPKQHGDDDTLVDANRRREARSIAGYLRGLFDRQDKCVADSKSGEARAAQPGDVAILFRTLTGVAFYEEALRAAGIDYYLVGGHAFYAQQEVYDVANLLRAVASPCDEVALVGALRSPLFGLADETLFWLARRGGVSRALMHGEVPAEIEAPQRDRALAARRILGELRTLKDRVGAATLLLRAIELTGYDAALETEFLGSRKRANLEKLVEQARESDAAGGALPEYLRLLWEYVTGAPKEPLAATTASDANVVRLMTVHQSKGLEFPVVVLADIDAKPKDSQDVAAFDPRLGPLVALPGKRKEDGATGIDLFNSTESDAEREERLRLFYVACTRAADRLVLSAWSRDLSKPEKGSWLATLAGRFDLGSGNVLDGERTPEPLARVLEGDPDSAPGTAAERTSGPSIGEVLDDAIALAAKRPPKPPAGVAAVAPTIDPGEWLSVSRLSGRLRRSQPGEPSSDDADDAPEPRAGVDPRQLGTLVHAVLERLDPKSPATWGDDVQRWGAALAPRHAPRNPRATQRVATELVQRFVASERWRRMAASAELARELEFVLEWPMPAPGEPAIVTGFLDALYRDDTGALHLVDYKTNDVSPADVATEAKRYVLQMSLYALAVERARGQSVASLTLVFLRAGVEHSFEWDAAARRRGVELVNAAIAKARE